MQVFANKTRIFTGTGALQALESLNCKRLLVVTDPYFAKNGMAQRVAQAAKAEEILCFDQVVPDPSVELVATAVARMQAFRPDTVAALGGGSAMDCAKAMVYLAEKPVKLVAIPTTSGSGSEVTDFAIITKNGIKQVLTDDTLQPDVAILDDVFLRELPPALIADAGFDVLAHALEALAAKNSSGITDALATESFCKVFSLLERSFSGNKSVRLPIHQAATMAGIAFSSAGLGLCHAMSHALGGIFHLPHGRLNAILLPAVVDYNAAAAGAKYLELAQKAYLGGTAQIIGVRNLRNGLIKLRKALQLPATLAQAGVKPAQVAAKRQEILKAVLLDPCCKTNPVTVTEQAVGRLLDEVTGIG